MQNSTLEKETLKLGFIPLNDCAPLVVAKELGFFAEEGLTVGLCRETSWANIRDKVAAGLLDGGHMLAPMPIAASLNLDGLKTPMLTAISLGLGGNAITVSHSVYQQLLEIQPEQLIHPLHSVLALKELITNRRKDGLPPLCFAHVFPFSCHHYLLRYWLASVGINPELDVRLLVIPPPLMVTALQSGQIDGFCVGEPWNSQAIAQGIGVALTSSVGIWQNSPEKVLGVTCSWAQRNPNTHQALLRGLLKSAQWLDADKNRKEAGLLLSQSHYVPVDMQSLRVFCQGQFQYHRDIPAIDEPDFGVFYRYAATFPWLSHAEWIIGQMQRWEHVQANTKIEALAAQVYRPDLYRQAAKSLEIPVPVIDRKQEGTHYHNWQLICDSGVTTMGADNFFDQPNVPSDLVV